jgi:hypothetical protein
MWLAILSLRTLLFVDDAESKVVELGARKLAAELIA